MPLFVKRHILGDNTFLKANSTYVDTHVFNTFLRNRTYRDKTEFVFLNISLHRTLLKYQRLNVVYHRNVVYLKL